MKTKILILTILATLLLVACNDDDDIHISKGDMHFTLPTSVSKAKVKNLTIKIENVNTSEVIVRETTNTSLTNLSLEDGVYNITVKGVLTEQISSVTERVEKDKTTGATTTSTVNQTYELDTEVRGKAENIEVSGGSFNASIPLHKSNSSTGFVISEIFFAGTKTPEKKQYSRDKFIEIYNNSSETLYADGLCIAETQLMTVRALNEYTPDVREKMLPVNAVYRIPGSGKEHPVKPGETIVLCDVGINHKTQNVNSIDLSKADFEWYDKNDKYPDTDTPEVPNMDKIVSSSTTIWSLHNRGYKGYAIFRPKETFSADEFNTQYAYFYKCHFIFGAFERWMNFDAWAVPNSWIIDAVQCSTPSHYEWSVMSSKLDASWTHSGDADDARYGHSVKRRVKNKDGNRIVLQDTNDSASDFIATAPNPSPGTVEDHK